LAQATPAYPRLSFPVPKRASLTCSRLIQMARFLLRMAVRSPVSRRPPRAKSSGSPCVPWEWNVRAARGRRLAWLG